MLVFLKFSTISILYQIILVLNENMHLQMVLELHEINYYMCKFSVINSGEDGKKIHCEQKYMLLSLFFSNLAVAFIFLRTWKDIGHSRKVHQVSQGITEPSSQIIVSSHMLVGFHLQKDISLRWVGKVNIGSVGALLCICC